MAINQFNASIVLYNPNIEEVKELSLAILESTGIKSLTLLDNSKVKSDLLEAFCFDEGGQSNNKLTYHFTGRNLGYGKANNIAIRKSILSGIKYHLVLNPDIELNGKDLDKIVDFLEMNEDIGLLMPKVLNPDGTIQYLCKRLPTPFDLIVRRFLPEKWFLKSKAYFEMRESGYNQLMNVEYLSGSFMFLRTSALKDVGTFDERFFMYPEDLDLSRRIAKKYRTVFYPDVSIIHHHGRDSYKSLKMTFIHIVNMSKYFWKWKGRWTKN